ncbi:MAG: RluA family pseudouridine synthase [Myxococcota bacterium]
MKPVVQWSVAAEDGSTVGAVFDRMIEEGAPPDGRVFLNGRPADAGEPVDVGDRLTVYPRRELRLTAPEVMAQRDGVLLVYKPAGLPSETTRLGEDSLLSALLERFNGGKVHVATRLDTMVSGVVVATLGRDASRRLAAWREAGLVRRTYVALAAADAAGPDEGVWTWSLARGRDRGGRHVARTGVDGAKPAETRYRVLATTDAARLLALWPRTGRMHQLRAHASLAGQPLWGDGRYGGQVQLVDPRGAVTKLDRPMLHAARVTLPHLAALAPPPPDFEAAWSALGGDGDDLRAVPTDHDDGGHR